MRAVGPRGPSPAASSELQRGSRAAHVTAKTYVRPDFGGPAPISRVLDAMTRVFRFGGREMSGNTIL